MQINSLWSIIVGTIFLTEVTAGIVADRLSRKRSINVALALQALGEVVYVFHGVADWLHRRRFVDLGLSLYGDDRSGRFAVVSREMSITGLGRSRRLHCDRFCTIIGI